MFSTMARRQEKQKAIELRKEGKSYSQIKDILGIGKGTLSAWLKDYPLSHEQLVKLRDFSEIRIEKYRKTCQRKKDERLKKVYEIQKKKIFPLSKREIFLSGLFLYWGEGLKAGNSQVCLTNTDPTMLKFFLQWLKDCFSVPEEKIRVKLHLYNDMDIKKETLFWIKKLNIKKQQFKNPYIKNSSYAQITYRKNVGHGTCNIIVGDARLTEEILMGLKSVQDKFGP